MGLGPETDNNEYALCLAGLDCLVASRCSSVLAHLDWSHVSLLSALLSLLSSADKWRSWDSCPPSLDWCHVGVLVYLSSEDRGARLNRACWTLIGSFYCHLYPVYLCR
ncbi:hypothetical protein HanRHA438_Chr01g0043751 [Helianthus annuus]|nr:hypothetical protein HanRHA438_Chr01g0043751 [Helianthus annuus]